MDNNHLLSEIIENRLVETVFQPIADLKSGNILGYEALSRGPKGTELYLPIPLISQAHSFNRIGELDTLLCDNTLLNAKRRGIDSLLFMNLDTKYIYEHQPVENIIDKLKEYGLRPEQIVIEFTEKSVISQFDSFIEIIESCRENGFLLCFDNVGLAYSNLFTIGKIRPDYIKADRKLAQGIGVNKQNRATLEVERMIADLIGARLIVVGVETREDLMALIEMGVDAAQGHIIGLPDKNFKLARPEALQIIREIAEA